MRCFILSQPKAGTYLAAGVLERLGITPTHWHVSDDHYEDYTDASKEEHLTEYQRFTRQRPIEATVAAIPDGAFAVGHLDASRRNMAAMSGLRTFLLVRDLRRALVSFYFFERRRGATSQEMERWLPGAGRWYIGRVAGIAKWQVPTVRFEDLRAVAPAAVETLAGVVGREAGDVGRALRAATEADSMTKADPRAPFEELWTPECERAFLNAGGDFVNARLGYEPHPGVLRAAGHAARTAPRRAVRALRAVRSRL